MNRGKLFIQNFLIYGIGNIICKIIPVIMLPIITSIIPNSGYYGINDMVNLIVSFVAAIAMMGMYDSMFRMFFEREDIEFKKSICSTAIFFVMLSSTIICILMFIFKDLILNAIVSDVKYNLLFFIIIFNIFFSGVSSIVSAPTRMENKRKVFLIANAVTPILSYSVSIPLLLKGEYVYALPIAAMSSTVIMSVVFYIINRVWFSYKLISFKYLKELIKMGAPLMPTFLMYWVFSSFDRVMIKEMLGLNELGVYSVASRIAQISQFIYTAFAMGWQYFVFSTMNDEDQKELISNVADYLLVISIVATIGINALSKIIFSILAKGSYGEGFIILPYLFISPLLLMIYHTIGNQFLIVKKTWLEPIILSIAVITNVALNYVLIPIMGIEGASIGTMIGYLTAVLICYFTCVRLKLIISKPRILISLGIFTTYLVVWRVFLVNKFWVTALFSIITVMIYIFLFKEELYIIKGKVIKV
ncbi:oligosaccharide flippase family protein [Clostridium sp.]|uniref:lipopolysaccharide biosynthesis protein n=1 Tax=Clostridium sp. TaxID=1506 RepID=UPI00321638AE